MLTAIAQVALGGAIGASARYLAGIGFARLLGAGFPWGTLFVNVAGSFVMGALVLGLGMRSEHPLAPLLITGLLGGFTTFSAFSYETVALFERGAAMQAMGYVMISVFAALAALMAGGALMRGLLG